MPKVVWHYKNLSWLWLTALIIVLDQGSKLLMSYWLHLYELRPVFSLFSFTLLHNKGAAFSFLNGAGHWASWVLGGIAILVSAALVIWMLRIESQKRWLLAAAALILGGALGNVIDRALWGHVVDFLLFHYQQMYFPAFNLADSAITVGAIILVIVTIFQMKYEDEI